MFTIYMGMSMYSYFIRDSIIHYFLLAGLSQICMSKICFIGRKVLDYKQSSDYPYDLVLNNNL